MALSEKARIEVYVPDLPNESYQNILHALSQEFTYTFGGCTIIHSIEGFYLSGSGNLVPDYVNLIYTDVPLSFQGHYEIISSYTAEVRKAVFVGLEEEAILVTAQSIFHCEYKREIVIQFGSLSRKLRKLRQSANPRYPRLFYRRFAGLIRLKLL